MINVTPNTAVTVKKARYCAISNPDEEDYLNSEQGQLEICDVITKSVRIYKKSLENQIGVGGQ